MTVSKVVIFGLSGHAKVIVDIIESIPSLQIIGFIDNVSPAGTNFLGDYKVIGDETLLPKLMEKYDFYQGVIGIGDNFLRSKVANNVNQIAPDLQFINCIHESANISNYAKLGVGNVVMPGVTVNSSSVIANHCILNTNSALEHDCHMNDFACLAPNATVGGNSTIGKLSYVGIGASVFHSISVGDNCIIGGGSVVNRNTQTNSVYHGTPAKFISNHQLGDKYL